MSKAKKDAASWDIQKARKHYMIRRWGQGYFSINDDGNVVATPNPKNGATIPLTRVIELAAERSLEVPLLIRFQDILRDRVRSISRAFRRAIKTYRYQNDYCGVYPIKVNQLREVVEEILDAGKSFGIGLEVGSKPELFAALALNQRADQLIICNGYKDTTFIRMALMGIKLGKKVILVVEKLEELSQILKVSEDLDVKPIVGMRARLNSKGAGRWAESGGETAKFGLSTSELLVGIATLEKAGMLDCFQLLHFHIGSQIPDITTIKRAVQEAARLYAKLRRHNCRLDYVDVGGGLGVDYDGSKSDFDSSTNYTLQEYANDIVSHLGEICDAEGVPHPKIVSESGRAIVAHHSVLVVQVTGYISKIVADSALPRADETHPLVKELVDILNNLETMNRLEAYHDAVGIRDNCHQMFVLGMLELPEKARIENLYWQVGRAIVEAFRGESYVPEEIQKLEDSLGDQCICNFSVFQSLLDHWALDQLFPIMPLTRHKEPPTHEATLVDITCDSDGHVDQFIGLGDVKDTLSIHELPKDGSGEPYYLGLFLMGAYQDIMGDLHNLFGRVNEAHVFLDPEEPEGFYIEEVIEGQNIRDALQYVQYDSQELKRCLKRQVNAATKAGGMKPSEGVRLLEDFEKGLKGYTYLSFGG